MRHFLTKYKRTLKWISLLIFIFIFFYTAFCGFTVYRAYSFRKHPKRAEALGFFNGDLPHKILARMVLFKHGAEDYDSNLMEWAFHSKLISDTFYNRWILERTVEHASEDERAKLLSNYPLTPTERLFPFIKKALEQGHYNVLPLLSRSNTEEGLRLSREWVNEKLVKPHNQKLFVAASGCVIQCSAVQFTELIHTFWPQLTPAQRERLVLKIAAHLPEDTNVSNPVFAWTRTSLDNGNLKMTCGTISLIGRFLSIAHLREQALETLSQQWNSILVSKIPLLFHSIDKKDVPLLARTILEKIKGRNPPAVLELFHHVAHHDITTAEELASSFLSEGDSEVKKGIIVILVRHGSIIGRGRIDDTFRWSAQRKTLYQNSRNYLDGSEAMDMYRKLSTHDYIETGKTWPPTYLRGGPTHDERMQWKRFIDTYPWFPGTDDAYYRYAFSQFAQRDYQGCLSTIKDYLKRGYWPDNDASPYIMHLIRCLALNADLSDDDMPFIQHLRNIAANPLATMITGSQENLDLVISSINWFLSNRQYVQYLNTNMQTLEIMRDVAETIKNAPADSVCRLIATKLLNSDSYATLSRDKPQESEDMQLEIDGDDEPEADQETNHISSMCSAMDAQEEVMEVYVASTIQSALYGIFRDFPHPTDSAMKVQIPGDPAEEAIHYTVQFLNSQFSGASIEGIGDGNLDEHIVLALLHSQDDFGRWREEFKPTFDFLSAISNKDIPNVVSERHLQLVKQRGR